MALSLKVLAALRDSGTSAPDHVVATQGISYLKLMGRLLHEGGERLGDLCHHGRQDDNQKHGQDEQDDREEHLGAQFLDLGLHLEAPMLADGLGLVPDDVDSEPPARSD